MRSAIPMAVIPSLPMAEREPNRADGKQNRNNDPEPNLAAYPQSIGEWVLHWSESVAFFERSK